MLALGVAERLEDAPVRPARARYASILADPGVGRVQVPVAQALKQDPAQTPCMRSEGRDTTETVLLVVVWVVPLLAAAALLAAAGLRLLAVALVVIEATVGLLVYLTVRPRSAPTTPRPAWLVPVLMLAALVAVLGVTLLAVRFGDA